MTSAHLPLEMPRTRMPGNQKLAFGALAVVLVALGLWTVRGFLDALAWATIFAVVLWPLYKRIKVRWRGDRHNILIPALFTLALGLIFVGPVAGIIVEAGREAGQVAGTLRKAEENGTPVPEWVSSLPVGGQQITDWWKANLSDPNASKRLLGHIDRDQAMTIGRRLGVGALHGVTTFIFMLLTLFFLIKQGDDVVEQLRTVSQKAFGSKGESIGQQIIASVHGTVTGLVLGGLGEGLVLGLGYVFAGVPHPVLIGILTGIAAIVPGAVYPVIVGAAGYLLFQGSTTAAILLLVGGLGIVAATDHTIRPVLIAGSTRLPFIWVLFGILGGIEAWGLLGLFLGPAILAALMLLWREAATKRQPFGSP